VINNKDDVAYAIAGWLKENIPADSLIVADHYANVYIPPEYGKVKVFRGDQTDAAEQLRKLVVSYRPRYIYYNAAPYGVVALPPIEELLPDNKIKLAKSFRGKGTYKGRTDYKIVVYEVLY